VRRLTRRTPARSLPLTRTTIVAQVLLALVVTGFLLTSTGVRLPVRDTGDEVRIVLPDAAGLDAADRPTVTVAGVRSGAVRDVRYDATRRVAVVRITLDAGVRERLFADAAASMTPRSALNDLVLDIDPGDPSAGPLHGTTVHAARRSAPTGYDRVLGVFDDDTRAYAQLLVGTLREATRNRPGPLREALRELPGVTDDLTALATRVNRRRATLRRLVGEVDRIVTATGRRGAQLTRAIGSARRTLAVTAERRTELRAGIERLPRVLAHAETAFGELDRLGATATPALRALRPAARALPAGVRGLRAALPAVDAAVADTGALVRDGRAPVRALDATVRELGVSMRTLRPAVPALQALVDGIRDVAPAIRSMVTFWPGTLSSADSLGVTTRAIFFRVVDIEPRAFGLPAGGGSAEDRRLLALTDRLEHLRPELFSGAGDAGRPAVLRAARALLADVCRRGQDFACSLVALVDSDPPEVLGR